MGLLMVKLQLVSVCICVCTDIIYDKLLLFLLVLPILSQKLTSTHASVVTQCDIIFGRLINSTLIHSYTHIGRTHNAINLDICHPLKGKDKGSVSNCCNHTSVVLDIR